MPVALITPLEPMKAIEPMAERAGNLIKTDNSGQSFEQRLESAINNVRDLEEASNKASYDLAVGKTDDTTGVMLAATKAQIAIQMTTQITTRAVNTYREIMQMNI